MTVDRILRNRLLVVLPLLLLAVGSGTPAAAQDLLIKGGTVLTITGGNLPGTDVLVRDGKIVEIGPNLRAPRGVRVIDASPDEVRLSRLKLCDLTARTLKLGLGLLGIETLEQM